MEIGLGTSSARGLHVHPSLRLQRDPVMEGGVHSLKLDQHICLGGYQSDVFHVVRLVLVHLAHGDAAPAHVADGERSSRDPG